MNKLRRRSCKRKIAASCFVQNHIYLRGLVVLGGHEGHLGDDGVVGLATDDHLELRPGLVQPRLDVTHGDVLLQARAEPSAGHLADVLPRPVAAHDRAVAPRGRALREDAHASDLGAFLELLQDHLRAQEPALRSPPLADRPRQAGLHRSGVLLHVVAVEAEPGLQTEAVAGSQPCQPHLAFGFLQESLCEIKRVL